MQLNDVFNAEGLLKQKFPQYTVRIGQVKMAELVYRALVERKSAVIEGATGIGKGFSYLIPIILLGEQAIVSTANKNLQNQLDKKDLPSLAKVFGEKVLVSWTVLKGKSNYYCLGKEELVTTFDGLKRIKEIKEGELVLSHTGKFRKVTKVFKNKNEDKELIEIEVYGNGYTLKVTKNHPIWVRRKNGKWIFVEAAKLKIGDIVAKPIIKNIPSRKYKKTVNRNLAKIIGYYLSEGSYSPQGIIKKGQRKGEKKANIVFSFNKNEEFTYVKELINCLKIEGYAASIYRHSTTIAVTTCGKIAIWLENNFGHLALNKYIPMWIFSLKKEILYNLLISYINGDGYKYRDGKYLRAVTISPNIAYGISLIANKLGYKCSINKVKKKPVSFIQGRKVKIHDLWDILIHLKQKNKSKVWISGAKQCSRIKKLTKVIYNGKYVYNLEVEKDHTFVSPALTTHNCHEHFDANVDEIRKELMMYKDKYTFQEADVLIQEIAKWAEKETIGDIEYLPFDVPYKVKEMITCDNQTKHEKGSDGYNFCFAVKARERAKESQIILVNHTLLALDISLRKESEGKASILPDVDVFIIDEAHDFEKSAVLAFSDDISMLSLYHLLGWTLVRKHFNEAKRKALANELQSVLNRYLPEKGAEYYQPKKVEKFEGLEPVIQGIGGVIHSLKKIKTDDGKVQIKIREINKEAEHLQKRLAEMMTADTNMLRWSEARDNQKGDPLIRLKAVPLDISGMLKEGLFTKTVICTSATLAIHHKFDFFRQQVGMPDNAFELIVASPFDYKQQALVYVTDGSQDREWEVEQLLKMSKGRAFVLFTSYRDMQDAYNTIHTEYPKFMQNQDGITRSQLLKQFKNTPNAVLFATKSFWEGVDIVGEKLSLVVIWKIPFETPTDIVFSSKCQRIDEKAGRKVSFFRLAIPDACLKLKQGTGRLIRSINDTGVIALMDSRVNFANYGGLIIDSLPPAYRTQKLEKVAKFFQMSNTKKT